MNNKTWQKCVVKRPFSALNLTLIFQLLGAPPDPHRGTAPGPRWGTIVPQTPWLKPPKQKFHVLPMRDAEIERSGGEWGGGIPLPSRLWGLGERRGGPAEYKFQAYKSSQNACGWRKIRCFVRHLYMLIGPLLDINWQNSRVGAKTSRQPGHFQVSRVSCIRLKGLQLRMRPVSLVDPGHLYITGLASFCQRWFKPRFKPFKPVWQKQVGFCHSM